MSRALDLILATVLIVVLAPVLLLAALAIRLGSAGPVLHRARRVGRGGRVFRMLKLRTMRHACGGAALTTASDDRVTRVGSVLRRWHIDEWPQLWNVIRGEMGLVGPRPEDPRFVDAADARWREVLSVRPGITGPSQLVFTDVEARLLTQAEPEGSEAVYRTRILPDKLASDVRYVRERTMRGDLRTLAMTAGLTPRRSRGEAA